MEASRKQSRSAAAPLEPSRSRRGAASSSPSVRSNERSGRLPVRPDRSPHDVQVQLTPDQVVQVCADAGLWGGPDPLLADFRGTSRAAELHEMLSDAAGASATALSRSLIRGLIIFARLPEDGSGVGVIQLSREVDMTASTVYRYLITLVLVGLARRNERTRAYMRASS